MKNKLLMLAAVLILPLGAQAQSIAKLEIGKKETYTVEGNLLQADTLILHDKATIQFAAGQQHVLDVQYAYVGEDCTITAAGMHGKAGSLGRDGEDGADAGNLHINIHLVQLGSLTIDTRGGDGGNGYIGRNGRKWRQEIHSRRESDGKGGFITVTYEEMIDGTSGEHGTTPGHGGNGGDIALSYSTSGFTPIFNRDNAPHSVFVLYEAGQPGKNGRDGYSYVNFSEQRGILYAAPTKRYSNGSVKINKRAAKDAATDTL